MSIIGCNRIDTLANALLKLEGHCAIETLFNQSWHQPRLDPPGPTTKEQTQRPQPHSLMDQILNQLGGLVLGSVPTILLFLLLIAAYNFLVQRPLKKVLAERRARTSGAIEQAKGAISAAEAETAVYEDKLRAAKSEIFKAREQKLKAWAAEREAALEQAKSATEERLKAARHEIEQSAATARQQIEGASAALSAQFIRAVLPAGVVPPEAVK